MSDANLRQIRVLHIVSAGALASSLQQSLFMPLLTRLPRPRVKSLVACLSPGAVPSAVLRQSGVPTYDLALSRKRFSPRAFQELLQATRNFRPDVIQAWGHTAQVISSLLRPRCEWKPQLIWNVADTTPLSKDAGFVDRQKLKYAARFSSRADRIIYSSEAAAAAHRRVGFPEGGHETIAPGVDATRFKPDFAARRKLREQLNLPGESFVIGMYAPFQPEYDFGTLIKSVGELIKVNPNVALVLAGHGVQKGNAPLMALVGGGSLATRVHLLGEWSDISALYNACDVVCSSALNDQSRMNVAMAMLCGVPCVATGIGAQGEVIGQHGVAIEPGNPQAFVKGITRVMQMPVEKRTFMAQGARKHALANYVYVRSLQKYLQLYYDLIGRQSLVAQDLPTQEIDPTLTVPPALPTEAELNASKRKAPTVADWGDPDSLESKVTEREPEELPKWRIEQEQERAKREADLAAQVAATKSNGDVLQVFESQNASAQTNVTPMTERARGVADDSEELLSADLLTAEVPILPRASVGPSSSSKKNSNGSSAAASASAAAAPDAAKQAALKAARMAALQPIAPAPAKRAASSAKPAAAAAPKAASFASPVPVDQPMDFNSTQPVLLAASELMQTSPAPAKADKVDAAAATQRIETLATSSVAQIDTDATLRVEALVKTSATSSDARADKVDMDATLRVEALVNASTPIESRAEITDTDATLRVEALGKWSSTSAEARADKVDTAATLRVEALTKTSAPVAARTEKVNTAATSRVETLAKQSVAAESRSGKADAAATMRTEALSRASAASVEARAEKVDVSSSQRAAALARKSTIASVDGRADKAATLRVEAVAKAPAAPVETRDAKTDSSGTYPFKVMDDSELFSVSPVAKAEKNASKRVVAVATPPAEKADSSTTEPLPTLVETTAPFETLPEAGLPPAQAPTVTTPVAPKPKVGATASRAELSLAPDPEPAQKVEPAASPLGRLAKALASASATGSHETVRYESKPIVAPASDAKRAPAPNYASKPSAPRPSTADAKQAPTATSSMTAALEKWNSSFDLGDLSLMATGVWAAAPSTAKKPEAKRVTADELSGPEALSLISESVAEDAITSSDPTMKLEALPASAKHKLAANGQ